MITEFEHAVISSIDKEELVSLTQNLVRIDSVYRPENGSTEKEVVAFIRNWIEKELKTSPLVEEVVPGRENIILTLDSGNPGPCLLLEGHTDVVSEGTKGDWTFGPFDGIIQNGRIYGRGSCDMKGGLACNLITAKTIINSGALKKGKLKLAILCDEEGMMIGVKDFISKGHADDVNGALVSEPEENRLCLSMKGAIRATVKVKGKMAHGAMPRTGINPNTRMARIILAFQDYEEEEIARLGSDPFLGLPSITFTVIQSPPREQPAQLNVMPGESIGYLDIRTIPGQNHETIKERLRLILKELKEQDKDFEAEIDFFEDRPVVTISKEEPLVIAAAGAYSDITGKEPVYDGVPGATDGTFLRGWKNIPSLVNGPGPRHLPHQVDEYIDISELFEAAKVYTLTALRFLSAKPL